MNWDEYYDWEKMSVSSIIWLMIKCFNYDTVNMDVSYRSNVESTVWFTIKIEKKQKKWFVDGQRPDIVKNRLIEFLDRERVREIYLKGKQPPPLGH